MRNKRAFTPVFAGYARARPNDRAAGEMMGIARPKEGRAPLILQDRK